MELIEGNVPISTVFKNGLIADNIGSYLSVPDLKSCRQVSEEWYKWASGPMRKKGFFVLRTLNDFRKLAQHPDEDYQLRPHKQVVFRLPILDGSKMTKCLQDFWLVHGEGLTYLKLENVEYIGGEILQDMLYRRTPNLKTLIIINWSFCGAITGNKVMEHVNIAVERVQSRSKPLGLRHLELDGWTCENKTNILLISAFLKLYPNIEILHLKPAFGEGVATLSFYESLTKVLDPLIEVQKSSPEIFRIQELDIARKRVRFSSYSNIEMPFVKTLENLDLPLSSLSFDTGAATTTKVVAAILSLFKDTLTKLKIYRPRLENSTPYANFPFGIELITLKVFSLSDILSSTMEFVKLMPSLEVLNIWGGRKWDNRHIRNIPHVVERTNLDSILPEDVKCLKKLTFEYPICTKEMNKRFSLWMPNAQVTWVEIE